MIHVPTEEKLKEIVTRRLKENLSCNLRSKLVFCIIAIKMIKMKRKEKKLPLRPFKMSVARQLYDTDRVAQLNFDHWYRQGVCGEIYRTFDLFSDEAPFIQFVIRKSSRYWFAQNRSLIHKVWLLIRVTCDVLCMQLGLLGLCFRDHKFTPICNILAS
jgi:hypothetical protein